MWVVWLLAALGISAASIKRIIAPLAVRQKGTTLTWPTLETWSYVANVAVVLCGILAAIAGGLAWHLANLVEGKKDGAYEQFKSDAEAKIAAANLKASEANKVAAQSGEGTARALAEAGSASERAHQLELESAQQQERAAKAERELAELQKRLAWRTIDPKHESDMVRLLAPYSGQRVQLFEIAGNAEVARLSRQIQSVFIKAGVVVDFSSGTVFGTARSGIHLVLGSKRHQLAEAVVDALILAGVVVAPVPALKSGDDNLLKIEVWPK